VRALAKVLVTGATGFIGSHVAHLLGERGDELRLGVKRDSPELAIADLDAERVRLELRDRRSLRRALAGVERVFHCGGVTSVRPADAERGFDVNVGGTKLLMQECLRAGVERVVYTSSAAAVGPARDGKTADETQLFTAGRLGIPYVNSVHEAEVEALRVAAQGLPLVCVNPAVCFGSGDYLLSSTRIVRSFLLGRIPVYTDGAINVVDVRDAAAGHLLADERGAIGERYLLGGRNFTFDRLFADLGRLSGVDPPVRLPKAVAAGATALLGPGGRWPLTPAEVRAASQSWTYRSTKARRELGWRARPHEETLEATVSWHLEREHARIARSHRSQQIQWRFAGLALGAAEEAAGLVRRVTSARP
jgi:dihydroflavonol-4-reductase